MPGDPGGTVTMGIITACETGGGKREREGGRKRREGEERRRKRARNIK